MRISDWSSDVCSSDLEKFELERAGVVPGGLRRGVEDRPGCGGRRAHEYGGRHPRMIDPGILQFPVFDEHPDLHRLAYHFISLHFIGAAVRGSFIAMGSPSQDPARMAWRAPGPAYAAPPVPDPHPGIREDRHWRRGRKIGRASCGERGCQYV